MKLYLKITLGALAGAALMTLFLTIYHHLVGAVPIVTAIKIAPGWTWSLPFSISRWWNILIGPIWAAVLVLFYDNRKNIDDYEDSACDPAISLYISLLVALVCAIFIGLIITIGHVFSNLYLNYNYSPVDILILSLLLGFIGSLSVALLLGLIAILGDGLMAGLNFIFSGSLVGCLGVGLICGLDVDLTIGIGGGIIILILLFSGRKRIEYEKTHPRFYTPWENLLETP